MYPRGHKHEDHDDRRPFSGEGCGCNESAAEVYYADDHPSDLPPHLQWTLDAWKEANPHSGDDGSPHDWPTHTSTAHYPGPSDDPNIWVTATGARLVLVDMSDLHLARALGCCVQKESITHPRSKAILAELRRRSMPPQEAPPLPTCTLPIGTKPARVK